MGRFDGIIADAKVAMTDIALKSLNHSGSNLKVKGYVEELARHLGTLEADRYQSLIGRFKDAMFDTSDDLVKHDAARQVVNLTYQLNRCLRCHCITCAMIDENCRCNGCLYGSHVVDCEGGTGVETRKVEKGVYLIDGVPVVHAEYDRGSGQTTVTLLGRNDVKNRFRFDPATGVKQPL